MFYSILAGYLRSRLANNKLILFTCLDSILFIMNQQYLKNAKYCSKFYTDLELELLKIVAENSRGVKLDPSDRNNFLNSILNSFFAWLDISAGTSSENRLREAFEANALSLRSLSVLLSVLTNEFSDLEGVELVDLRSSLYFLSFLIHEAEFETASDTHHAVLKSYLTRAIKVNYKLKIDKNFVIRHQLFGFRQFLNSSIFDSSPREFVESDLEILNLIKNELRDKQSVYAVLKIVDGLYRINPLGELKSETELLFWSLFEQLALDEKLSLICDAYTKREFLLTQSSLSCLYENQVFNNEFTVVINQLSGKNFEDSMVR